ncbi:hypothetical protein WI36_02775 [Burkholderia ubonensis]|uniref:hypothetical protein n=1 Tax=Burkholderia ubonensis TaxID=101571 RepID=UPI00076BD835|nr:hypothetical protein [Burkholderia ubonensis]KUZ83760.1 hypothetical protein WI36_02775 [Burkholderia ubonensis]
MNELPEKVHRFIFGLAEHASDPLHHRKIIAIVYKGEVKEAIALTIENIRMVSEVKKRYGTKVLGIEKLAPEWQKAWKELQQPAATHEK